MRIADSGLAASLGAVIGLSLASEFERELLTFQDWIVSLSLVILSLASLILISRSDAAFRAAANGKRALAYLCIASGVFAIFLVFFGHGLSIFYGELKPNPPQILTSIGLVAWSGYYVIWLTEE